MKKNILTKVKVVEMNTYRAVVNSKFDVNNLASTYINRGLRGVILSISFTIMVSVLKEYFSR
jgi:hypothetical protein